jgi:hypothetical protein
MIKRLMNVGRELARETIVLETNPAPMPLLSPQVLRGMTWDQTQAATVMMLKALSDM